MESLSIYEKANLLASSDTEATVPRPRVLKQNHRMLDQMLLPFVDEIARRQYNIRAAAEQGNTQKANELRQRKSKRHGLFDQLQDAKRSYSSSKQQEERVNYLKNEFEFYTSLRADVTQDEGSYDPYLDKDEAYERQRLKFIDRIKQQESKTR